MSQTLQALNSILKYKQERERQKIDRSLAMMDMATRLKQQKIENLRNNRLMDMRLREEGSAIELHEKNMLKTEQALQKLKQDLGLDKDTTPNINLVKYYNERKKMYSQMDGIMDVFGSSQKTPSTVHTYELKAGDVVVAPSGEAEIISSVTSDTAAVNYVKFQMASGAITTGEFTLYGRKIT